MSEVKPVLEACWGPSLRMDQSRTGAIPMWMGRRGLDFRSLCTGDCVCSVFLSSGGGGWLPACAEAEIGRGRLGGSSTYIQCIHSPSLDSLAIPLSPPYHSHPRVEGAYISCAAWNGRFLSPRSILSGVPQHPAQLPSLGEGF